MSSLDSRHVEPGLRGLTVVHGTSGEGFLDQANVLCLPTRCLGETCRESVPPVPGDLHTGVEYVPVHDLRRLEDVTEEVYSRIFRRIAGKSLCRVWNHLPHINGHTEGLENYRAFCRGRARAFEAHWGSGFTARLAAGSAVGGPPGRLAVIFAASSGDVCSLENPEQVPAYEYPPEHGPKPPSFSRATRTSGATHDWVFISGTAAIKGHRSVAPGQLDGQVACTLDNLRLISERCDLGSDLGLNRGWRRHFKIYLRRAADFATARAMVEQRLLRPGDHVIWLQAEICRAELEIEIEAALMRSKSQNSKGRNSQGAL